MFSTNLAIEQQRRFFYSELFIRESAPFLAERISQAPYQLIGYTALSKLIGDFIVFSYSAHTLSLVKTIRCFVIDVLLQYGFRAAIQQHITEDTDLFAATILDWQRNNAFLYQVNDHKASDTNILANNFYAWLSNSGIQNPVLQIWVAQHCNQLLLLNYISTVQKILLMATDICLFAGNPNNADTQTAGRKRSLSETLSELAQASVNSFLTYTAYATGYDAPQPETNAHAEHHQSHKFIIANQDDDTLKMILSIEYGLMLGVNGMQPINPPLKICLDFTVKQIANSVEIVEFSCNIDRLNYLIDIQREVAQAELIKLEKNIIAVIPEFFESVATMRQPPAIHIELEASSASSTLSSGFVTPTTGLSAPSSPRRTPFSTPLRYPSSDVD
jgi:hypothetical protein